MHDLEIFWHFAEDVNVAPSSGAVTATPAAGGEKLVLLGASPQKWELAVAEGWVSPAYGERWRRRLRVLGRAIQLPAEHGTLVLPLGAADAARALSSCRRTRVDAVGYVYEHGEVTDYIVFGEGKAWSAGRVSQRCRTVVLPHGAAGDHFAGGLFGGEGRDRWARSVLIPTGGRTAGMDAGSGGERVRPAVTKVFLGGGAAARNCGNLESGRSWTRNHVRNCRGHEVRTGRAG